MGRLSADGAVLIGGPGDFRPRPRQGGRAVGYVGKWVVCFQATTLDRGGEIHRHSCAVSPGAGGGRGWFQYSTST